jgi:hypothetical protein
MNMNPKTQGIMIWAGFASITIESRGEVFWTWQRAFGHHRARNSLSS